MSLNIGDLSRASSYSLEPGEPQPPNPDLSPDIGSYRGFEATEISTSQSSPETSKRFKVSNDLFKSRVFDFQHPEEEVEVPRGPYTDDEQFAIELLNPTNEATAPLQLSCTPGFTKKNIEGQEQEFDGVVRLLSPELQNPAHDLSEIRKTLADFVVVADVSGSMQGTKILQLQKTMNWLVENLNDNHRMCIITFNNRAIRRSPLTVMTEAGKLKQRAIIQALLAERTTNITQALNLAAMVLSERVFKHASSVVLLLTDGQDDTAYENTKAAISAIASKALLACVGLGDDHDAHLLSSISQRAHGTFEYCPDADSIAPTIGAIKGAVTTAAALGVKLLIETSSEPKIHNVSIISRGQGLLYPFHSSTAFAPYAKVSLEYTCPQIHRRVVVLLEESFTADAVAASEATLIRIDTQKNRELVGRALLQTADLMAANEALEDKTERAKQALTDVIAILQASISVNDPLTVQLIKDCTEAFDQLNNPIEYQYAGVATAYALGASHSQQVPSTSNGADLYATPMVSLSSQSARRAVNDHL